LRCRDFVRSKRHGLNLSVPVSQANRSDGRRLQLRAAHINSIYILNEIARVIFPLSIGIEIFLRWPDKVTSTGILFV
jgi:hypothetical protein